MDFLKWLSKKMDDMFSQDYYLGISIFIVCLQVLSILGNGFIVFLFFRNSRLRSLTGLRLIFILALTDGIFAIAMLPQMIYFIVVWDPIIIDADGSFVVASGIPLLIQFKINLTLMIGIALDRIQAIRFPVYYRQKNPIIYSYLILSIGLLLVSVDITLTYSLKIDTDNAGCIASGCFVSSKFRTYWGLSNMILAAIGVILTLVFAFELGKMRKKKQNLTGGTYEDNQLQQANKLSICIMLVSVLFVMIPSVLVGLTSTLDLRLFKNLGPFYSLCLLLTGLINSIVYISLHLELRKAAKQVFGLKTDVVSTVMPSSSQITPGCTNMARNS